LTKVFARRALTTQGLKGNAPNSAAKENQPQPDQYENYGQNDSEKFDDE
jgi:hypothetical protein